MLERRQIDRLLWTHGLPEKRDNKLSRYSVLVQIVRSSAIVLLGAETTRSGRSLSPQPSFPGLRSECPARRL